MHRQGRLAEAERIYRAVLQRQPDHFDALHLLGLIAAQSGHPQAAVGLIGRAIAVDPSIADAHSNLAKALNDLKRHQEAIASCETAIALAPNSDGAYINRGNALAGLQRHEAALASYDKAIELSPGSAIAHNDRGNTLQGLHRYADAVASYGRAVAIKPDYAEAYVGRGVALQKLKRRQEAAADLQRAIALNPQLAEAYNNLGNLLVEHRRYDEANAAFAAALNAKPALEFARGTWIHTRMKTCDWTGLDAAIDQLLLGVEAGQRVTPPFPMLSLPASLEQQLAAARSWTAATFPESPPAPGARHRRGGRPLRVGYFSADFFDHATAWLIAGLFEQHDRSAVESVALSFGPPRRDEMSTRIAGAVDRFIDVRERSDVEVAALARELEIDIGVDLKGFTIDGRSGIFAARAAPIQVNYLGYPGTMAADFIDYIIADATVIPVESQPFYAEKIVYLPGSYQVNDSKRTIADRAFTRAECGLAEGGVVFCCFNASYKINPRTFDGWMRILGQVDGSVLWLFADNPAAVSNLKREAEARAISPERLVFAERLPLADHLARHRLADLFLDTTPYNAHTTASDALWAGLPVLTLIGDTFAGRVAASLLKAVGLPELITSTPQEYEDLAAELARRPRKLAGLKRKLARQRLAAPLFDTERFARELERAYAAMFDRYDAGLPPDHIDLS